MLSAEEFKKQLGWILPSHTVSYEGQVLIEKATKLYAEQLDAMNEARLEGFNNGRDWMKQGREYITGWRDGIARAFDSLGERRDERVMILNREQPFMEERIQTAENNYHCIELIEQPESGHTQRCGRTLPCEKHHDHKSNLDGPQQPKGSKVGEFRKALEALDRGYPVSIDEACSLFEKFMGEQQAQALADAETLCTEAEKYRAEGIANLQKQLTTALEERDRAREDAAFKYEGWGNWEKIAKEGWDAHSAASKREDALAGILADLHCTLASYGRSALNHDDAGLPQAFHEYINELRGYAKNLAKLLKVAPSATDQAQRDYIAQLQAERDSLRGELEKLKAEIPEDAQVRILKEIGASDKTIAIAQSMVTPIVAVWKGKTALLEAQVSRLTQELRDERLECGVNQMDRDGALAKVSRLTEELNTANALKFAAQDELNRQLQANNELPIRLEQLEAERDHYRLASVRLQEQLTLARWEERAAVNAEWQRALAPILGPLGSPAKEEG